MRQYQTAGDNAHQSSASPTTRRRVMGDRFHHWANVVTGYAANIALGFVILLTYSIH